MSGTTTTSGQPLLPANTTLLQPGSRFFRLSDALSYTAALSAANTALQTQVNAMQAQLTNLENGFTGLAARVTTLEAQVTSLRQFQRSFDYQQVEISTGTIFLDQRTIYRRSYVISTALPVNQVFIYAHTIPALNYFVDIRAELVQQGGQGLPLTFVNTAQTPPWVNGVSVWGDATNLYFSNGNTPFTSYLTIATVWYTATDR